MQPLETGSLDGAIRSIDELIQLTHASKLKTATLLLRMAKLEIQIKVNEISPEELDAFRLHVERQFDSAEIIEIKPSKPRQRSRIRG